MLWTVLRSNEPNEPQTNTNELLYKAPGLLFTNVHKKEAFDLLRTLTLLFIRRRFSCSRFLRWPWRSVSLTTSRTAIDYQCPFPWHWLMVLSGLRQTECGVWYGVITRDDFGPDRGGPRHPFPTTILLLSLHLSPPPRGRLIPLRMPIVTPTSHLSREERMRYKNPQLILFFTPPLLNSISALTQHYAKALYKPVNSAQKVTEFGATLSGARVSFLIPGLPETVSGVSLLFNSIWDWEGSRTFYNYKPLGILPGSTPCTCKCKCNKFFN